MAKSTESVVENVASKAYWQEADARVLVDALAESGESLSGFSRRHGFDPRRLGRWRSVLAGKEAEAVQFHPVQLIAEERAQAAGTSSIEIELLGGRRVHVGRGFDAEDLRVVVAVLEDVAGC